MTTLKYPGSDDAGLGAMLRHERQITGVLEELAARCSAFAKRAQPHTVAARLTLADHLPVLNHLAQTCLGACAGTGVLSRAYPLAGEPLHRASDRLDRAAAEAVAGESGLRLQLRHPPIIERSPGKRPLVDAAKGAADAAAEFGQLPGSFPLAHAAQWVGLAGQAVTSLESVFSHEAILIGVAADRLGRPDPVSAVLAGSMFHLVRARQQIHLAHIVLRDA